MKLTMSSWKRWLGLGLVVAGLAILMSTPALADGHSGHSGHSHHTASPAAPATAVAPPASAAAPAAAATDSTVIQSRCASRMAGCEMDSASAAAGCAAWMARCGTGQETPVAGCVSEMNGCDAASSCPARLNSTVAPETGAATAADSPAAQTRCPVTGDAIDKSIFIDYRGRRVYFCCPMCEDEFRADPARSLAILDPAPIEPLAPMGGCGMESSAPTRGHCGHSRPAAAPVTAATYTCPMHPEIVRDAPGSCPKCGMYLVPREE